MCLQALNSPVKKWQGGRFDHIKASRKGGEVLFTVIIFDAKTSVPNDDRPWTIPGDF